MTDSNTKNNKSSPQVIAIVGPTATGKTIVGATMAKELNSEVISADSQLVYQDLAIGVARPTVEEMQGIAHHCIGVAKANDLFSAGTYQALARPVLEKLINEQKIPIIVGGTGFYLTSLLQPAHLPVIPVNSELRAALKAEIQEKGLPSVYERLRSLDPNRAKALYPQDAPRIIRALEINLATGRNVAETPTEFAYLTKIVGLGYRDKFLHWKVINRRLDQMLAEGMLEEVEQVYERYGPCLALQKAHGYPELIDVLENRRSLDSAIAQIQINIRQYAKRQMTWFKRYPQIEWVWVDDYIDIDRKAFVHHVTSQIKAGIC